MKSKPRDVDEYLAALPEASREALGQVRAAIRRAVPQAEESVAYGMAGYKLRGRPLLYFAGWKKHYSLYPVTGLLPELAEVLAPYEVEKGTIRFPLDARVPVGLIEKIAKRRASVLKTER